MKTRMIEKLTAPAWPAAKILANVREVPLGQLEPDPDQPRREFDPDSIAELAGSLAALGQLQPIRVRPLAGGEDHRYAIVVGERRWRAAQQAGLRTLACVVVAGHDEPGEVLAEQLAENTAREDLAPMDRARAIRKLQDRNRATTVQIARELGLSQSAVSKSLALLDLPPSVQDLVASGDLDPSSAYAISTLESPEQQIIIAADAVGQRLTRRTIEDLVRRLKGSGGDSLKEDTGHGTRDTRQGGGVPPRTGVGTDVDATGSPAARPGIGSEAAADPSVDPSRVSCPVSRVSPSSGPRIDPAARGLNGLADRIEAEDAILKERGAHVRTALLEADETHVTIAAGRDPKRIALVTVTGRTGCPSTVRALWLALGEALRTWPEEMARCNRCNAARPQGEHPCRECGCPEFRVEMVGGIER